MMVIRGLIVNVLVAAQPIRAAITAYTSQHEAPGGDGSGAYIGGTLRPWT